MKLVYIVFYYDKEKIYIIVKAFLLKRGWNMKRYLFTVLILMVLVLAACEKPTEEPENTDDIPIKDQTKTTDKPKIETEKQDRINSMIEERAASLTIIEKAEDALDQNLCTELEGGEMHLLCLDRVTKKKALVYKSEELCQRIDDEKLKTECLDGVYLVKAREEKDASYCPGITASHIKKLCEQHTS